jgi:hypothetical protein
MTFLKNRKAWLEAALFLLIPALVYLPNVFRFTFYRDDWYYIYDGLVLGPNAFLAMFEHLRPLRGPLFAGLFALFGADPLPYHLLIFAWRLIGGAGMFWLLRLLWPNGRQGAYWAALLFTVYPGFLWWVGGFEYQPMVLSLGFQVFSIAFMLKGILAEKRARKIQWTLASILFSWVYLGLVEYAIGMELFRLLCAYVLVSRGASRPTLKLVWLSIKASIPALLGPIIFLVWRMFFFENIRPAADVSLQLGRIGNAPQVVFLWFLHLFESAARVLFMAWTVPLHQYFDAGTLRETILGWSIAIALVAVVFLADRFLFGKKVLRNGIPHTEETAGYHPTPPIETRERWEPVIIGLLGVLGAMLPIVAANRFVSFGGEVLRRAFVAVLVLSAALTHFNLSAGVADEARILSGFWQQVAWRAPGISTGTTLVVDYPSVTYSESSDLVWGPANIIYYPQARQELPLRIPISAARMEPGLLKDVVAGGTSTQNYIIINVFRFNYDDLLVISQPTGSSCVHVMDNRWPAFAAYEDPLVVSIAGKSKIKNIQPQGMSPVLPENLFGSELSHGWCYYYERADLARQTGDWEEVARLGAEAIQKELAASDPIEWIPFMQAHVLLGDADALDRLAEVLKLDEAYKADREYYKVQFCKSLHALEAAGFDVPSATGVLGENLFCR